MNASAVPATPADQLQHAHASLRSGQLGAAASALRSLLQAQPRSALGWLVLGDTLDRAGLKRDAIRARATALRHGRSAGWFRNMETTPEPWRPVIKDLIADVNRQLFDTVAGGLQQVIASHGATAMRRVAHAMNVFIGRVQDRPYSPHQVPKFLFFPGLEEGPFHDPDLHPWSARLVDSYERIREEALAVLHDDAALESFLSFQPGQSKQGYLDGDGAKPAWDAFFFYRHGKRYDANHVRSPFTSALLEDIERCEIEGQAPEICFSVLQPGTRIMPHYGVTNTRLVYHLPLLVPEDCALHVFGGGEHAWREREPVLFDDTFQHEAWNRSALPRIVLLMDCWNPHLRPEERSAMRVLVELISAYQDFNDPDFERVIAAIGT